MISLNRELSLVKSQAFKQLCILKADWFRLFDVTIWPLTFFLSITLFSTFLTKDPRAIAIGALGVVGWRALYHFSLEVSQMYMDEYWSGAIDYFMVSPVRTIHLALGGAIVATVKFAFVALLLYLLTGLLYSYWMPLSALAGACALLAAFGVELGVIMLGFNYYLGQDSFAFNYAISDVLAILSGVFYPLAILPQFLQQVALIFPSTHAFLLTKQAAGGFETFSLLPALATLAVWAVIAVLANRILFEKARKEGKLLKLR